MFKHDKWDKVLNGRNHVKSVIADVISLDLLIYKTVIIIYVLQNLSAFKRPISLLIWEYVYYLFVYCPPPLQKNTQTTGSSIGAISIFNFHIAAIRGRSI